MREVTITLPQNELPQAWYNLAADLPWEIPAPRNSEGMKQVEKVIAVRPKPLQAQEESRQQWIEIPDEVRELYIRVGRATPLVRAIHLEEYLDTPARIYLKREDVLPTGSFKVNSSLAQAYFVSKEGYKGLVSETGAGQWGSALALAARLLDLKCKIFMAKSSSEQKPYRRIYMNMMGCEVISSPSNLTEAGRKELECDPNHPGSIGTGISEALETAINDASYAYVSGSNLSHVLMHQTVIGLEAKKQIAMAGEEPDVMVACVGGGSNLGGFFFPFIKDFLDGKNKIDFCAAESIATPRLTKGEYRYDHGDPSRITPLQMSYTLGHRFVPPSMHVGGLRQHNGSPLVSLLRHKGVLNAHAYGPEEVFEAGRVLAQTEGYIAAPESCHAVKAVIDQAIIAKEEKKEKVILACLSGHGLLDLEGYGQVLGLGERNG